MKRPRRLTTELKRLGEATIVWFSTLKRRLGRKPKPHETTAEGTTRPRWWWLEREWLALVATLVFGAITVLAWFFPQTPDAVDDDNVLPISIATRIVDGTGNVVNATNARLLEYVLYREDRSGEWHYVTTSAASGDEYTFLGIPEPGVYDIEAYDFGMFLGVATNVPARLGEMRLTIRAPTRAVLRTKALGSSDPVAGVQIQVFTDQNQNEPMLTSLTDSQGEAQFSVWPNIVEQEYYIVRAVRDGQVLFSSEPVRVNTGREAVISMVLDASG